MSRAMLLFRTKIVWNANHREINEADKALRKYFGKRPGRKFNAHKRWTGQCIAHKVLPRFRKKKYFKR